MCFQIDLAGGRMYIVGCILGLRYLVFWVTHKEWCHMAWTGTILLFCKAKMQYLLTCKVTGYSEILPFGFARPYGEGVSTTACHTRAHESPSHRVFKVPRNTMFLPRLLVKVRNCGGEHSSWHKYGDKAPFNYSVHSTWTNLYKTIVSTKQLYTICTMLDQRLRRAGVLQRFFGQAQTKHKAC